MTIPGPETDELCRKAEQINAYIAAELYMVKDDDFPDRYFNVGFIGSPKGEIIYKRYKATSDAYEGGMLGNSNPHDFWDEWIEKKATAIRWRRSTRSRGPRSETSASAFAMRAFIRKLCAVWP